MLSEEHRVAEEKRAKDAAVAFDPLVPDLATTIRRPTRRFPSHTGSVAYHALCGNYGVRRTYVSWEPFVEAVDGNVDDGDDDGTDSSEATHYRRGVRVTPEHARMYFFDAGAIHAVKLELATAAAAVRSKTLASLSTSSSSLSTQPGAARLPTIVDLGATDDDVSSPSSHAPLSPLSMAAEGPLFPRLL